MARYRIDLDEDLISLSSGTTVKLSTVLEQYGYKVLDGNQDTRTLLMQDSETREQFVVTAIVCTTNLNLPSNLDRIVIPLNYGLLVLVRLSAYYDKYHTEQAYKEYHKVIDKRI